MDFKAILTCFRPIFIGFLFVGSFIIHAQVEEYPATFNDSLFYRYRKELREAVQQKNLPEIAQKQVQLGVFFQRSQLFTEAIDHFNMSLHYAENPPDTLMVFVKTNLGEIYISLGNYSKARHYLEESNVFAIKTNNKSAQAKNLQLLGTCFEKTGQPAKALEYQRESLDIFNTLGDANGAAAVNESMGSIYEDLEQFETALNYFTKANDYFDRLGSEAQLNTLNNIADVYRKTGDYTTALTKTFAVLHRAATFNNAHQIESAHKDLSKTYALMGDYQKAHFHLTVYQDMIETQFYSQNFDQLNALQTVYDSNSKESKIALLTQENKTSGAKQLALVILVFSLVIFGLFYLFYQKRKRSAAQNLEAYKVRLIEAELENKAITERNLQNEIQLKTATLSKYSLTIAQKNKLIEDVSGTLQNLAERTRMDLPAKLKIVVRDLQKHLESDNEWDDFIQLFQDIHPFFIKNLSAAALEKLSSAELRLSLLVRLSLTSKEIASILRITPDSVRVARYRLRKKLPIETQQELSHFMLNL